MVMMTTMITAIMMTLVIMMTMTIMMMTMYVNDNDSDDSYNSDYMRMTYSVDYGDQDNDNARNRG